MKKNIIYFIIVGPLLLILINNCNKNNKPFSKFMYKDDINDNNNISERIRLCDTAFLRDSLNQFPHCKPIIRFTWRGTNGKGGPSPNCEGGVCGICIGICIKSVKDPPPPPANVSFIPDTLNHENYADFYLLSNDKLLIVPYSIFDNGYGSNPSGPAGTLTIPKNEKLPKLTASKLSCKEITILAGTYVINYSCNAPFGIVVVNINVKK